VPLPEKPVTVPLLTDRSPATKPVTGSVKVAVKAKGAATLVLPLGPLDEVRSTDGRSRSTVKVLVFELALTAAPGLWAVA
jgi:hypothetical protein